MRTLHTKISDASYLKIEDYRDANGLKNLDDALDQFIQNSIIPKG